MYIDWMKVYHNKYGWDKVPSFVYPIKRKFQERLNNSKDLMNDLYKYCYKNKIDINDAIDYTSDELIKSNKTIYY